jgi:hypothetical protein
MRSTRALRPRRPSIRLLVPLLLLSACDGGETAVVARPHEMRIAIISGRGGVDSVRDATLPAGSQQLTAAPIVARVFAVLDDDADNPITQPGRAVRLPPVTVEWRALQPACEPLVRTSALAEGDTAVNFIHRPTEALTCRLVAEALVDGQVFGADTSAITFRPGPVASFEVGSVVGHLLGYALPYHLAVGNPVDAWGNPVEFFPVSAQMLTGSPPFQVVDTMIVSPVEAVGTARISVGTVSREVNVWAFADLRGDWRLEWACHDLAPPAAGEAHTDSVHYRLDGQTRYGDITGRGLMVGFAGTLVARRWERGQPVHESTIPNSVRYAAQRPGVLEWSPGQTAPATATGYAGGSLCEPLVDGRTWNRFTPVRIQRP